jgi:hypothetical protein
MPIALTYSTGARIVSPELVCLVNYAYVVVVVVHLGQDVQVGFVFALKWSPRSLCQGRCCC